MTTHCCLTCWPLPRSSGTACRNPLCECHGTPGDVQLLTEALTVLRDARCKLTDVTLRTKWGLRKNALIHRLEERLLKE